jgi:hypothetical protein
VSGVAVGAVGEPTEDGRLGVTVEEFVGAGEEAGGGETHEEVELGTGFGVTEELRTEKDAHHERKHATNDGTDEKHIGRH